MLMVYRFLLVLVIALGVQRSWELVRLGSDDRAHLACPQASPPRGGSVGGFSTEHIKGGLLGEDGVLWDESGDLVAFARQIAVVPSPRPEP